MSHITKLLGQIIGINMLFISIIACTTTKQVKENALGTIADIELRHTLQKAFDRMGGIQQWEQLQSLRFRKKTILYLANGEIEKRSNQQHYYQYQPTANIQISWKEGQADHLIEMKENTLTKYIDQQIDAAAKTSSLKNNVLAATFVMGIPFKIMDEGTKLTYEGIQTLNNGKKAHIVKATYDPSNFKHHTKSDIWWHYFEEDTYEQLGYAVQLEDHSSYIENLSFQQVGGFLFTTERKSWRVNEKGEKLYLRAEYEYADFEVN